MKACEYCKHKGPHCIDHVDAEHCPNTIPLKTKPRPKKKLSQVLQNKKRLTQEQLERFRGESGKGLSQRFDERGEYSIELTRRLLKAKNKAQKFILYSDMLGRRVYVADKELVQLGREESALTFDKKEALLFYEGFDDPEVKQRYYAQKCVWLHFETKRI
jgi:arsenate reductase-like glutaredoxin family protein